MYNNIDPKIINDVRSVLATVLRYNFNNWVYVTHIDRQELETDAITETLLTGDPITGVQNALKQTRSFLKLRGHNFRALPWDPIPTDENPGFDLFHAAEPAQGSTELPVDLSVLNDRELRILEMVGNDIPYSAVAESLGYEGKTSPARYIQNQLTSIRRKLCGVGTRKQAMAWLEAQ